MIAKRSCARKVTMPTKTAKVVRIHEPGGPEVLKLEELPIPEPGENEVRLRVKAFALNRTDVMYRENKSLAPVTFPSKLGSRPPALSRRSAPA
jgi:D-arabinose 1-dehydrogenase-like Zn-dependent alcohol dehydrogenase